MTRPPAADDGESPHWRRNLAVCVAGSFTTIVAMTLLLPFLPLYVAELGVRDSAAIVELSGLAYGATFFTAALCAPLWGRLADRYGRKPMLIRASLGMAVAMSLIGMAATVWQLVVLRLLAGFLGGYASGSNVLVATQTPKARTGWALGVLASGIMAGNLAGPLIGGALPPLIGIRHTFWLAGAAIFVVFLATSFFIKEARPKRPDAGTKPAGAWSLVPDKRPIVAMLVVGSLLMFAVMSIEPIITVYVQQLVSDPARVTWVAGLVLAALLLIPQAFVTASWQLIALRFLMGMALGGLLPCVTSLIRHHAPARATGMLLGYATSSQYVGQVAGPLVGGFIGGHLGMRPVFLGTSLLMMAGAALTWRAARAVRSRH